MKTIAQQLGVTDFPFRIKDKKGRLIYREDLDRVWERYEYDSLDREIYCEDSNGVITDNRPKEEEIITLNGIRYKRIDD